MMRQQDQTATRPAHWLTSQFSKPIKPVFEALKSVFFHWSDCPEIYCFILLYFAFYCFVASSLVRWLEMLANPGCAESGDP